MTYLLYVFHHQISKTFKKYLKKFIINNMAESYQKNIIDSSKYTYNINECDDDIFIFELIFKKTNQKTNKLRIIKNSRNGKLVSLNHNINYYEIKKISVTAIDLNNPHKEIIVECPINQNNNFSLIIDSNIIIEFNNNNGLLEANYNLITI